MQQAWERSPREVLLGKYEEKRRPLGRQSLDGAIIKMDLK
jgi:hypothetical protein